MRWGVGRPIGKARGRASDRARYFAIWRRSIRKRVEAKLLEVKQDLRERVNEPVPENSRDSAPVSGTPRTALAHPSPSVRFDAKSPRQEPLGNSARTDLCGGRAVMAVPTATQIG